MPYVTVEGPPIKDIETKQALTKELTEVVARAYKVNGNHVVTIVKDALPEAGKRILVIDDEPGMVDMVKDWLESKGYEVITALDGSDGLTKAQEKDPAVIILDIKMPGMDGFEVLSRLRSNSKTQDKPVIMLTRKREIESMEKATHYGATDYIMKPFSVENLLSMVRRYILYAKKG
jgi:DNA-binding response OmpR family regulator/phenylpyruvate tautomerase PptA (4-oxalocrotonate tautomerase family)